MKQIHVTADALLFSRYDDQLRLLLIRRKNEPFKDLWALPGGFIDYGETPEAAAIRELQEETGIKLEAMQQLHTFGRPDRDPRGHTVSVVHYAIVEADNYTITASDDAAAVKWENVKDIKTLAFDHMEILRYALMTLFHDHL